MALMWTTVDDVKSRWLSGAVPATDPQLETLLGDAEDAILAAFPTIADRIASEEIPKARVQKIAARMVVRYLRNPDGARTRQETAGPFTESVTVGGSEPGEIYLSDEDRAELSGNASGGAFMIDTLPAYAANGYFPSQTDWQQA